MTSVRADRRRRWLAWAAGSFFALCAVLPAYGQEPSGLAPAAADSESPCEDLVAQFGRAGRGEPGPGEASSLLPDTAALASLTVGASRAALRSAQACVIALAKPGDGGDVDTGGPPPLSLREVKRLASRLERLLAEIDRIERERDLLAKILDGLRDRWSTAHRERDELPPGDYCNDCDALVASIDGLIELSRSNRRGSEAVTDPTVARVVNGEDLQSLRSAYCRLRRDILTFPFGRLELEHRYFTWTETWQTVEGIRRSLSESALDCP